MTKLLFLICSELCIVNFIAAQNVGIGTTTPTQPLSVKATGIGISQESPDGLTKIGFYTTNGAAYLQTHTNHDLNFSTANGSIQMVLKTSGNFGIRNNTPNASLSVGRGTGTDGTAAFFGTTNTSHFNYSTTEDTYIRAGKNNANVIINDISGGKVGIGMSNPTRAMLEQNGAVGATSAIFGGDGTGISLQKNWPAIGFNSYLDGAGHKSINAGYGAQLGLNQSNGSLYLVSFPFNAIPNTLFASYVQRFYISRFGKIGLGTDDPYADMEIVQRPVTFANEDVDIGITYTGGNSPNNASWNTHVGFGSDGGAFASLDNYSFWHKENSINSGNWYFAASIAYNGYYYQISDIKLKKDITYLDKSSLTKLMMLKPASYHYKTNRNDEPLSYGFIAQDVEKVFPEMVITGKTNKLMSYTSLIPILTKGIQEQQQQIEVLQKENTDLKARLEKLEKIILK